MVVVIVIVGVITMPKFQEQIAHEGKFWLAHQSLKRAKTECIMNE